MKHTVAPLKLLPGTYERDLYLKIVPCDHRQAAYFLIGGDNREANAEFIVKACNSHDELVKALKAYVTEWHDHPRNFNRAEPESLKLARAGIAEAERKTLEPSSVG